MPTPPRNSANPPTIRDLYPEFSDDELKDAEEHILRYLEITLQIYERISSDPEAYARFKALTDPTSTLTMDNERSPTSDH
jgi:hypothetical protein